MTSFALAVIRFGLARVESLAPGLSARLAYGLFCRTDNRRPKKGKAVEVHREGMAILDRAKRVPVSLAGGGSVMSYLFPAALADAPKVLVVHGWGSGAAYLARMGEGLQAAGASVVLMDLPGHGGSPGRHLDVRLAVQAIRAVAQAHGGFDTLIGHSFGGATSLMALSGLLPGEPVLKVRQLALIGAPGRLDFIFADFARMMHLDDAALQRLEAVAEARTGIHPSVFRGEELASTLGIPVLVLHAHDDKEVPAEQAERYTGRGPAIDVEWMDGFGHRRIVSAAPVIARLADFVLNRKRARAA